MPIASVTPTITGSSAYTAGNAVGGKMIFLGLGNSGVITRAVLRDKAAQVVGYDLFLFGSDPALATITDKTAFAINGNLTNCFGVIPLPGMTSGGTGGGLITVFGLYLPFHARTGEDLYGALVTRGTPTYTSASDIEVSLQTELLPR